MIIDNLIEYLTKAKEIVGGDKEVYIDNNDVDNVVIDLVSHSVNIL